MPSGQKLILGLCSVRVFSAFCLVHVSCVKIVALQFLSSIAVTEKYRVGGGRQSCCFWSKIPWWKRKCKTARCRDTTASSFAVKVLGRILPHIFTQSPQNVTIVCRIDCLPYQDEFFINNPLYVKENDEHAPDFPLQLSRFFHSRWVWTFCVRLMLSSQNACLIIARVSAAFLPRFAQNFMLFLCRIHREIASGQIHDSK
jgi:hypothetical protein